MNSFRVNSKHALRSFSTQAKGKSLTLENMNQNMRRMEYAVRGLLPITAEKLSNDLAKGVVKKDFEDVLYCNIGNPQAVGQRALTWYREVMALVDAPSLLNRPDAKQVFRPDVVDKANEMVAHVQNTGAYTGIKGVAGYRENVAQFIKERDGYDVDPERLYLINGASSGITHLMQALIASPDDGVMIPIPQYPIYSALITLKNGHAIGYYLDEEKGWSLTLDELKRSIKEAKDKGVNPRALVVINPGNPTGNILSYDNLVDIVKFCYDENLVILADEVYQENIYSQEKEFVSLRKVVKDLGEPYASMEIASFHSTSKGIIGECGRRGGYMELSGFSPEVEAEIYKLASSALCSNLNGQVMTDLMVSPPKEGGASYGQFQEEYQSIFGGLERKSAALYEALNDVDGISCQPLEGAMYAFPKIDIPKKAIEEATRLGQSPDTYYALSLLNHTGICAVPGSGFGQEEDTFHIRMTFLPEEGKLLQSTKQMKAHHEMFVNAH